MILRVQKIVNYLPIVLLGLSFSVKANSKFEAELLKIDVKTTKNTKIKITNEKRPIIILNFWASWCAPCVAEFKSLNKMISLIGKENILVIGINNDEEDAKKLILKIENKYNLEFESVMDEKVSFADKFMVSKVPTSIIFINKKFYKFIPEKFDFDDKNFIEELKTKAKILN